MSDEPPKPQGRPTEVIDPVRLNLFVPGTTGKKLRKIAKEQKLNLSKTVTFLVESFQSKKKG